MNELYVNVLFVLTWYLSFSKGLFRSSLITSLISALCYYLYGYGFYLVSAYAGCIIFFLYTLKPFKTTYKIFEKLIGKIFLTILILFIICRYEIVNIIHLLPYISFLILLWTNKKFKNKKVNFIINLISDVLIMVYAYKYHVYALFIYKVYNYVFRVAGGSLKKMVDYTNKKIGA